MKFKYNKYFDDVLTEELLTEGNSTYLRDFLFSIAKFADIDLMAEFNVSNKEDIVIHHTDRDGKINEPNKLILMLASKHVSMHNTYRGDKWVNNAHEDNVYSPTLSVKTLLNRIALQLMSIAKQDEDRIS